MTYGHIQHDAAVLHGSQILVNDGKTQAALLSGDPLSETLLTISTNNPFPVSPSGTTATVLPTDESEYDSLVYGSANAPSNVGLLTQDLNTPTTFTFKNSAFSTALATRNHPIGVKLSTYKALFFGGLTADPQVVYIEYRPGNIIVPPSWVSCGLTLPSGVTGFPTAGYTATPIPNPLGTAVGKVFVAGGNSTPPGSTFYLIPNNSNPSTCAAPGNFTIYNGPLMRMPRTGHTASLLPDGRLILVGGRSANPSATAADHISVASSAEVIAFDLSQ
jgi:hypothetical protein